MPLCFFGSVIQVMLCSRSPGMVDHHHNQPWLRQVARNVCRMWRRRQRATLEPLDTIAEMDNPTAAARFRRTELAEIVRRMLAQVSPKSREVLALHYLGFQALLTGNLR